MINSNTTLVKVKFSQDGQNAYTGSYSNTTLVKVKSQLTQLETNLNEHSNTTLVKVKFKVSADLVPFYMKFKYNTC